MRTDYNPNGLKDNCGFCAISRGLQLQNHGVLINADELYEQTLQRLNLERQGGTDPVPRQLIFPEPDWSQVTVRTSYSVLVEGTRTLSDYTITQVAHASYKGKRQERYRLRFDLGNRELLSDFIKEKAARPSTTLRDFAQKRWNYLKSQGKRPSIQGVEGYVANQLVGHSIIGSKSRDHFINAEIDPSGTVKGFDAQDGRLYDGKGLLDRLESVDLYMFWKA